MLPNQSEKTADADYQQVLLTANTLQTPAPVRQGSAR